MISIIWYDKMILVQFGAFLRCAEGEKGHPLALFLPISARLTLDGFFAARPRAEIRN